MDPAAVQLVVLAAGSSVRMGRDKLVGSFAGVPLARRVVLALRDLDPIVVATPAVAAVLDGIGPLRLVLTPPTAGPSATLALADAAVPADRSLAVVACDLPFLDAARIRAFLAAVPPEADVAFPVVGGEPGHPVVWSPAARQRIADLPAATPPSAVRADPALRVTPVELRDDSYVADVDTPEAWTAAERRAGAMGEG